MEKVADACAPVNYPRNLNETVANRRVADAASLASPAVFYFPGHLDHSGSLPAHPQQPGAHGANGVAVAGTIPAPLAPGPVDSGGVAVVSFAEH